MYLVRRGPPKNVRSKKRISTALSTPMVQSKCTKGTEFPESIYYCAHILTSPLDNNGT